MGRTKPLVPADYIVGLVDGEGCFYVNFGRFDTYRSGVRVQLHFHLKLQETDRQILFDIRDTLQCGNVYLQKEMRKNHTQCYRYTVSAHRDVLQKIIPFFKKHPLRTASKRKNFQLFCRIATVVASGEHLETKGVERIRRIKQQMNKRTNGLA